MKTKILDLIDFEKVDTLLEGFNKSTGFVTAILDLEGNVLSKSGWRQICTEFHRIHPETSKKCTVSDTELANKMGAGEKYHFYKCLNGLVDVAVPIIIKGEHIANLFSGQFFFEKPDSTFFKTQAEKYGFDEGKYLTALKNVPVVSQEKVKTAMDFLLNMTQMISDLTFQKEKQIELNLQIIEAKQKAEESEEKYRLLHENAGIGIGYYKVDGTIISYNTIAASNMNGVPEDFNGKSIYDIFPKSAAEFYLDRIKKAVVSEIPVTYEDEVNVPKGNKYFLSTYARISNPDGEIEGIQILSHDITQQKAIANELQQSQTLLAEAEILTGMGSWEWDVNNDIAYWSNGMFRIFKRSSNEGAPNWEQHSSFYVKKDFEAYSKVVAECLKNGTSYQFALRAICSDGEIRYCIARGTADRNAEQKIVRIWGTLQDITENRIKENALRESETQYRNLANSGLTLLWTAGTDKLCNYFNEPWLKFTGRTLEQEMGNGWAEGVHPDDFDRCLATYVAAFDKREAFEMEYRLRHVSGEFRWILDLGTPNYNSKNEFIGYIGNCFDITERKEIETRNQLLVSLIEKSQDFIGLATPDQHAYFVNQAGQKMIGLENDEMIRATKIEEYFFPEDLPFLYNTIIPQLMNEGRWAGEFRFRNFETGNPIDVYYDLFLTEDPATKNILNIATITRDITLQKEIERKLIEAKQKAEESDKLKSAFLANMSHEIRTPMNGILGFAELLQEPDLTGEQQQEYIRIIEKSGTRMLNIINDIIDISKIESGQMKVSISETNVNDQIEYLYKFFKTESESKGILLSSKCALSDKNAVLLTDSEKLYAILTNLIKNAIKYTNTGSIEFGYQHVVETGHALSLLQFYVKDTGIGIPNNKLEAIFERFIQADIADKMARQGAGLGLAITRAYVQMLGGEIWVESEDGKGSTFYFTLPCNTERNEEPNTKNELLPNVEDIRVNKLKILIAEDDESSATLITIMVGKFGKEILRTNNGVEAVEICRNNPDIDLVLMDIQLPEIDGYEATQQIRQFNTTVIIIAQTAFGLSGDREKAIDSGCNDYISKPIQKVNLIEIIQRHLKK